MLQLNIDKWVHILIVLGILIVIYLFYKFLDGCKIEGRIIDVMFAFIISGALCSLVDKVFWNGSLDYILIRGFFTFDLKDVYINVFNGLLLLIFVIDYKGLRKTSDDDIIKDFIRFIRNK